MENTIFIVSRLEKDLEIEGSNGMCIYAKDAVYASPMADSACNKMQNTTKIGRMQRHLTERTFSDGLFCCLIIFFARFLISLSF